MARACAGVRELSGPVTLSGIVTARGGVPLAGARVGELDFITVPDFTVTFPSDLTVGTDATGRYSISDLRTQVLRVSKPGYFTGVKAITRVTEDTSIDIELDPWDFISLGEFIRRTIQPGDPTYGDPGELCHRFALTALHDGTLDVSLKSTSAGTFRPLPQQGDALRNWDLHVERPDGDAYRPPPGATLPLRVVIPVKRGGTYQIRVLSYANFAREYELRTQLR